MFTKGKLLILTATMLAFSCSLAVATTYSVSYANGIFNDIFIEDLDTGSVSSSATAEHYIGNAYLSNQVWGSALQGSTKNVIKLSSDRSSANLIYSDSHTSFADSLTFTAQGLDGQLGYTYIPLSIDRYFSLSFDYAHRFDTAYEVGLSYSSPSVPIEVNAVNNQFSCAMGLCWWNRITHGRDFYEIDNQIFFKLAFKFGEAANFEVFTHSYFQGDYKGDYYALATTYWAGLGDVFDAQGNLVTAFSVTSASGTDYLLNFAPAVPEPTSYAMLAVGLAMLSALRRRKP